MTLAFDFGFVYEGKKWLGERKQLRSCLLGVITWIPSKYEQSRCFCPLSSAHHGGNVGKVLGALSTLGFLPLVYLLTCVTVVKSSARADEYPD